MAVLEGLEPRAVFQYFEEICGIPHGSKNTKYISNYLVEFAKKHMLAYEQDELGNVIIKKPGTLGYEASKPVIIQGHMDMVCEREKDCGIDFEKDGLALRTSEGYISAEGTTLGGDDGIAVAYALAILASQDIPHPPLEVVITVDEEIGMLGAAGLDMTKLTGKTMLNLDSEEEGHFLISCAGGATACIELPVNFEMIADPKNIFDLTVTGITGGHSGVEIHKGGANSNKVLGEVLAKLLFLHPFQIVDFEGGSKDNAIPRESVCRITLSNYEERLRVEAALKKIANDIKEEYQETDPDMAIYLEDKTSHLIDEQLSETPICMDKESTENAILALCQVPNGVILMDEAMENMVHTSLNLGILKCNELAGVVSMSFCVRSSANKAKEALIGVLDSIAKKSGGKMSVQGVYPGWEYKKESKLRELVSKVYEEQYGEPPIFEAIHAGVECGLFADGIEDFDCVSYGPNILDIHTTNERLEIASVARTYALTLELLKELQ